MKILIGLASAAFAFTLLALFAVSYNNDRVVEEDMSITIEPAKYRTYCLKGLTVLLTGDTFMYELTADGKPVPCK